MKKSVLIILLMAATMMAKAQLPQSQRIFPRQAREYRNDYTLKLDSVIGSDNFDWTRWKKVYVYTEDMTEVISYQWRDQAWCPDMRTDIYADSTCYFYWSEGEWAFYQRVLSQFMECNGNLLIESEINEYYDRVPNHTLYEYDENCNVLLKFYGEMDMTTGEWKDNNKWEYHYTPDGLMDTLVFSYIRNGEWRESQREVYTFDENHQCIGLLSQSKGGFGPFGNNWMDRYRYEFEYQDGIIVSEHYYQSSGWFGGELSLNGYTEYAYDSNGNVQTKTTSVSNGSDWIVRDVYENHYDLTVDASKVLGLSLVWDETVFDTGLGYGPGNPLPLNNLWLSCSVISSWLDTQFTLYCSGFAGVEENELGTLQAYCNGGNLVVVGEQPADITVFDMLGRKIAFKAQVEQCEFSLTPGLYLVSNGIQTIKVSVR